MTPREQVEKFGACVYEPGDWVELRAIRPDNARKSWTLAGRLIEQVEYLGQLNREGFNIHVAPNPRRTSGKSGDDAVSLCRCLFADFDKVEGAGHFAPVDLVSKGRAMLYAAKWSGVAEGGRNHEAFRHACALRRDFDLSDADAWDILTDWNQRNNPPLSEVELKHTFESAVKYGKKPVGSKLNESGRTRSARQGCFARVRA